MAYKDLPETWPRRHSSVNKGSDDMTTRVVRAAIEDKLGSKQRGQLHAEPFIFAVAVLLQLIPWPSCHT